MHLPGLILDLTLILGVSSVVALLFKWMGQPVILGYLLAGILVGPNVVILPTITDASGVRVWAELGVIFLLFLVGLELSFKKLMNVGKFALIAASIKVLLMTLVGFGAGKVLGWDVMSSFFLGGVLAISSTTIIIKSFEELGVKSQAFAGLSLGILLMEDILAILLLAILSSIARTHSLMSMDILKQIGTLFLLIALSVPVGHFLVPRMFKFIRGQLTDEIRVVVSLAFCLLLVMLSSWSGFSPALGAFLAGAILGEISEGERAERLLRPIRDLFGAVFFTSIGMLVDVSALVQSWKLVAFLSLLTVVVKVAITALASYWGGQQKRTSLQIGLTMGQIGEFSFIIATLGLSYHVVRADLFSITVAVALMTTFTTPYLIRAATRLAESNSARGSDKSRLPRIWEGHLVEFEIHPHFSFVGMTLQEMKLRERFGASAVALIRGERRILAPGGEDRLMPYDRLVAFGTDLQLTSLESFLKSERHNTEEDIEKAFVVGKVKISSADSLCGKTLRDADIRDRWHGLLLGIERHDDRLMNPKSSVVLEPNDVLWIYGERSRLKKWS